MPPPAQILVVDDDRPLRSLMMTILRRHGFSVDSAADGVEALERIAARRFDVMLLDLMMPRMNGFELLSRLARRRRDKLPAIVILSGADLPDFDGTELVTDRVKKPFNVETLVETVVASISRRSSDPGPVPADPPASQQPTIH